MPKCRRHMLYTVHFCYAHTVSLWSVADACLPKHARGVAVTRHFMHHHNRLVKDQQFASSQARQAHAHPSAGVADLRGAKFSWSETGLPMLSRASPAPGPPLGLTSSGLLRGLPCPTPEAPVRGPRSLLELKKPLGVTDPTLPILGVSAWGAW